MAGAAADNMLQIGDLIELQTLHDAKAVAQRRGQRTGPGGGANQGKRRQVDFNRARRRPFANHDIQLVVFHCRIEHLFHHRREAMDLIDKQHIVWFEVGEHRGEIARFLQHRAGGGTQIHPHFIGDDIGQGGFPQPWRAKNQQVIEGVAAQLRRLDKDLHLRTHLRLADILCQQFWADGAVSGLFKAAAVCRYQPVCFNHPLPHNAARSASRISVSLLASGRAILLTIRLASCGL